MIEPYIYFTLVLTSATTMVAAGLGLFTVVRFFNYYNPLLLVGLALTFLGECWNITSLVQKQLYLLPIFMNALGIGSISAFFIIHSSRLSEFVCENILDAEVDQDEDEEDEDDFYTDEIDKK